MTTFNYEAQTRRERQLRDQHARDRMMLKTESYQDPTVRLSIISDFIAFLQQQERIHSNNPYTPEATNYFLLLQELNHHLAYYGGVPNFVNQYNRNTITVNAQNLDDADLAQLITIKNQELHHYKSEMERRYPSTYYQRFKNFLHNLKCRKHMLTHHPHHRCCHHDL